MSDPITTDDLYGPSKPDETISKPTPPLTYEETPEVPIQESSESKKDLRNEQQSQINPPRDLPPVGYIPKKSSGCFLRTIGTILIFLALFIVGIWLSSFVRQYMPWSNTKDNSGDSVNPTATPVISQFDNAVSSPSGVPAPSWKTYQVVSGVTKEPIAGISIRLPSDVLAPICDSTSCGSQGTYLPGGTRLTIAPRGAGQVLPDFRGSEISDVNGVSFTSKKIIVQGISGTEFTGVFTGRTVSGYAFSKMRGVMIPLSDTLSLEINHFTPSGIVADFEEDDTLFNTILGKMVLSGSGGMKGTVLPTNTITQIP